MVSTRLILVNEQASPPVLFDNCPFFENIAVPIDFQISDVRNPGEGTGSHSYTVKIPGTGEVDQFFEDVYDVNISLQKFNPNLKVRAYYYVDEIENFNGHLQIVNIVVDETTKSHYYECNILGDVTTLFTKIKTKFLTDLDFSSYNHTLSYANITASWASALGTGYKYPLIDWGKNNSDLLNVRPQDLRACLHRREILQKIFSAAGYTWTSNFLDSTFFKRNLMPPLSEPQISSTALNNGKFLAVSTGAQAQIQLTGVPQYGNYFYYSCPNPFDQIIEFPSETYDTGNIFNNISYAFTVPATNYYNVVSTVGFSLQFYKNLVDVSGSCTVSSTTGIHVILYNSTLAQTEGIYDVDVVNQTFGASNYFNGTVQLNNVQLTQGHIYYMAIKVAAITVNFPSSTLGFNWLIGVNIQSGSQFSAEFTTSQPYEGSTVVANNLLPTEYKQIDFISDLVKEFNLFIMPDRTNPTNLIIEDRPNFYFTTARDWTAKHDKGSEISVKPMGELDFQKLRFLHAEDGDFYNKKHIDEFKTTYGYYNLYVTNDFIKNEKVIQPTIAPTPYAQDYVTGVVLPQILKKENNSISQLKTKPRSLYWSGSISMPVGVSWKFKYNNGANSVWYNTMPHAGHYDNPWNPTLDLSWNVPDRVYYYYPNQQITTNSLYNKYYSQYINQITDKNSKIIRTKFYLTPHDISIFDFRYPVFCVIGEQQGYYLVNKIEQYNPLVSSTTMVELLKLVDYAVFTPAVINSGAGGGNNTGDAALIKNNITKGGSNQNTGSNSMVVGGNNNQVTQTSDSVAIINSNNAIASTVSNFFGVGLTKSSKVLSNTANLYNQIIVDSSGFKKMGLKYTTVYSDFTVDGSYTLYYVNTNYFGLAVTATIDASAYPGMTVTFKMIDNAGGTLYIANGSSPPGKVEFVSSPYNTGLNIGDSLTIHSDGTNLYVI